MRILDFFFKISLVNGDFVGFMPKKLIGFHIFHLNHRANGRPEIYE